MFKPARKRSGLLGTAAIIVGLIAVGVAVFLTTMSPDYLAWDRGKLGMPRVLKHTQIQAGDLPALVAAMNRGTSPVRYAALIFSTPDRPSDEDALNIQVSVENGNAGFDWVLLAPRNIQDEDKFRTFAQAYGFTPVARSENGVSFLRVECPDAAQFAASVVTEMYHYPANEPLGLVYEGFDWPQS